MDDFVETTTTRSLPRSLLRGALCRCPNCGEGRIFRAYLKVVDQCAVCGEELFHQRADDAPPYVVMFISGHLIVGSILSVEVAYHPAVWVHLAIWLPLTIVLSLALLPPVKGMLVGFQWALRMHGFGGREPYDDVAGGQPEARQRKAA